MRLFLQYHRTMIKRVLRQVRDFPGSDDNSLCGFMANSAGANLLAGCLDRTYHSDLESQEALTRQVGGDSENMS